MVSTMTETAALKKDADVTKVSLTCYPGAAGTENIGRCRAGFQVCRDGVLGPCEASRIPIEEICNGADDDCDGSADEELLNACGQCGDLPMRNVTDLTMTVTVGSMRRCKIAVVVVAKSLRSL